MKVIKEKKNIIIDYIQIYFLNIILYLINHHILIFVYKKSIYNYFIII